MGLPRAAGRHADGRSVGCLARAPGRCQATVRAICGGITGQPPAHVVIQVAMNFNKEANELAKVAATGDKAAILAQFGKTGGTCKACHDNFRN